MMARPVRGKTWRRDSHPCQEVAGGLTIRRSRYMSMEVPGAGYERGGLARTGEAPSLCIEVALAVRWAAWRFARGDERGYRRCWRFSLARGQPVHRCSALETHVLLDQKVEVHVSGTFLAGFQPDHRPPSSSGAKYTVRSPTEADITLDATVEPSGAGMHLDRRFPDPFRIENRQTCTGAVPRGLFICGRIDADLVRAYLRAEQQCRR
jgi:hypothetical protein